MPVELPEKPYCSVHCSSADYALLEESGMLPYVKIELNKFSQNVHTLLKIHGGDLPLLRSVLSLLWSVLPLLRFVLPLRRSLLPYYGLSYLYLGLS